ncbi:hypothetical protein B0A79_20580 [Flavobacterium piscis]|uniref:Uncharacterized protein n=1 Tax=Flavobacterium piscis TaxID=1114874 RepID=A0ABX2XR95_9FLAO|nr:hypothetical protein FLP_13825 [Flavobacterium piscis]OXE98570.1 hypothetical protein B0A79_20580 [Flavobacterium piscis]
MLNFNSFIFFYFYTHEHFDKKYLKGKCTYIIPCEVLNILSFFKDIIFYTLNSLIFNFPNKKLSSLF